MPSVRLRDNEPFEVALRRFKRTIEKTGLLTELRAREFYEKPTAERKRKLAAAVQAPLQAPAQPAVAAQALLDARQVVQPGAKQVRPFLFSGPLSFPERPCPSNPESSKT